MKNRFWLWTVAGLALTSARAVAEGPAFAAEAKAILHANCAGCHDGGKAKGGFGFVLDRDRLVGRNLVSPGHAESSDLFQRVKQGEMPPRSSKQRPSPADVDVLKKWIDGGAIGFDPPLAVSRSPADVVAAILRDLDGLDPRQRRFTRYLTLNHLGTAKDVDTTREAAGKLLNSLSWHPRLSLPQPVGGDGTTLRIDLRWYKWTAAQWERLAAAHPYRMQSVAEAKALGNVTGSEAAVLRADWFVATASRPPFYQDLLQLPASDRALERLLSVDVQGDIADDNVIRSGFNDSGVSKNNRLLERHDSAYGTFWRSYDFSNNAGRQNLFEHPIGPTAGAVSFQPAGGEMIFHLPNGLQAYMLVDAKGQRIDKGPIEIVADPRRPDQKVETGVSCMSCHARGLLFKADQLRGHVEKNAVVFGAAVVDAVRATHPRPAQFQVRIEDDNARYLKALATFGVRDPDQEPVNLVTQRFEGTLDGAAAAAELGLKVGELEAFLKQNPDQAKLLGALRVKGGSVQRSVFQDAFPELARRFLAARAADVAANTPPIEPAFVGHTAAVNAIAFSADGKLAASGGDDRTVRLWAIPSGQSLATLEAGSEVYAVAFSEDGKFCASAGRDRVLRLWDIAVRKQLRVLKGHTDSVRCLAFSPDGKRLVSGGDDRSLRLWDVATAMEVGDLLGHTDAVTSVVWASGKIVSGGRDGVVRTWDAKRQKLLGALEGHAGAVLCVALAPDGKTVLSGGNDQTIRLWQLADGKEMHAIRGHQSAIVAVRFAANEFVSAESRHRNFEKSIRFWNLASHEETGSLSAGADDRFGCVAISADGRSVLAGGPGGTMKFWQR